MKYQTVLKLFGIATLGWIVNLAYFIVSTIGYGLGYLPYETISEYQVKETMMFMSQIVWVAIIIATTQEVFNHD